MKDWEKFRDKSLAKFCCSPNIIKEGRIARMSKGEM
jgi:hypothetical protein